MYQFHRISNVCSLPVYYCRELLDNVAKAGGRPACKCVNHHYDHRIIYHRLDNIKYRLQRL